MNKELLAKLRIGYTDWIDRCINAREKYRQSLIASANHAAERYYQSMLRLHREHQERMSKEQCST